MKQTGTVIGTEGMMAKIAIVRESACGGNCASCSTSCSSKTVVEAKNLVGAKIGDKVVLEMESSKVLFTAFIVYALPIILLIVFYFIGEGISGSEAVGAAVGFLSMALAYAIIIVLSKKNKNKYALEVEKILN